MKNSFFVLMGMSIPYTAKIVRDYITTGLAITPPGAAHPYDGETPTIRSLHNDGDPECVFYDQESEHAVGEFCMICEPAEAPEIKVGMKVTGKPGTEYFGYAGADIKAGMYVEIDVKTGKIVPAQNQQVQPLDDYEDINVWRADRPYDGTHRISDKHVCMIAGLHFHSDDNYETFYRPDGNTHWRIGDECRIVCSMDGETVLCTEHKFGTEKRA